VDYGLSHQSAAYELKFEKEAPVNLILNSKRGEMRWDGEAISGYQVIFILGGNDTFIKELVTNSQGLEWKFKPCSMIDTRDFSGSCIFAICFVANLN
jgi:hypothetical protein